MVNNAAGACLNALDVDLVESQQCRVDLAALLELLQCLINSLLMRGPPLGLVQLVDLASKGGPLLQQLLPGCLVPHMQARTTQPCTINKNALLCCTLPSLLMRIQARTTTACLLANSEGLLLLAQAFTHLARVLHVLQL